MSALLILIAAFNVFLTLAIAILWIRSIRPAKEDPRLSRGLQLLQSKIAVLEDLSDRTDRQVTQLSSILDERTKQLQGRILTANEMLNKIDHSMTKSLEVAEIFQSDIPHEDIVDRKNQTKYVQAAKMAHEGKTVDEIIAAVDLPRNEIEFIAKVNKDQLMFEPELLPEWAKQEAKPSFEDSTINRVFSATTPDLSSLNRVSSSFKEAVSDHNAQEQVLADRKQAIMDKQKKMKDTARQFANDVMNVAGQAIETASAAAGQAITEVNKATKPVIRKVQFPRVDRE
jgi:hypothetical protein